jgi:hypothetical protein
LLAPQVVDEFRRRLDTADEQRVARSRARDVEKVPLRVRLSTPLLNELDRRARRRRRPRGDGIRAALAAYVALPDGALDERPAERVRDLLGSVRGLPSDLASDTDRYLSDLGGSSRR